MAALAMKLTDYVYGPVNRDFDPIDRAICIAEKIDDVSAMEERIEELESELEDHQQLEDDLKTLEAERDELQKDLDDANKEKDEIDSKLADAREQIERLEGERTTLERAVTDGASEDRVIDAIETAVTPLRAALRDLLAAIDAAKLGKVARVGSLVIVETAERTMGQMGGALGGAIARARELAE